MSTPETPPSPAGSNANELNNLLQIINGTTDLMENIWAGSDGSGKYLAMLRESVARAAEVTAQLVERAGGATKNVVPSPPRENPKAVKLRSFEITPRVMVVDDEPVTLGLLADILQSAGYKVVTADSGCQALDLVTRDVDACDLVLLDYAMPFMDGDETFRRLREISPDLPVILATGFIQKEVLGGMLDAGLAAFIHKPLPPEKILAAIAHVLGTSAPMGAARTPRGIAAAT